MPSDPDAPSRSQSANLSGEGNLNVQIQGDNNVVHVGRSRLDLTLYRGRRREAVSSPAVEAGEAEVVVIARSDGTRASVVKEMFKTNIKNGIMGTFRFDRNGDIIPNKWISFDKLKGNAGVYEFAVVTKVGK